MLSHVVASWFRPCVLAASRQGASSRYLVTQLDLTRAGLRHASGSSRAEQLRRRREQWGAQSSGTSEKTVDSNSPSDVADDSTQSSSASKLETQMPSSVEGATDLQTWVEKHKARLSALDMRVLSPAPVAAPGAPMVLLLGTQHDQNDAAEQVMSVIEDLRPQSVGLELCSARHKKLFPVGVKQFAELKEEHRKDLLNKRLRFGKDQLAAAVSAYILGVEAVLCDREQSLTEARILGEFPPELLTQALRESFTWKPFATLAWLGAAWRLRGLCYGYEYGALGVKIEAAAGRSLGTEALPMLASQARQLNAEGALGSEDQWNVVEVELQKLAKSLAPEFSEVDKRLNDAVQNRVLLERNQILCARFQRLPGRFSIAVLGKSHVDAVAALWNGPGLSADLEAELLDSPSLSVSQRLLGQVVLRRLRSSLPSVG